ncbi:MAG: class I SAM-dependent methyltransferase [Bdellovibrionales bacterium]
MELNHSNVCTVCQKTHKKIFNYQGYEYFRCDECLHVTTLPYPTSQAINEHYAKQFQSGNYNIAHKNKAGRTAPFQQYISLLNEWFSQNSQESLKNKRVLDIGCFTGELLIELEKAGAQVTGIELQTEAAKIAQDQVSGKVFNSSIFDVDLESGSFDVVVLSGVIEHVTDPGTLIKKSVEFLKPNGLLLIQTPNSESWLAKTFGKYWPPYQPVEHIHLFSHESLQRIMKQHGCTEVHFQNHWKKLPIEYVYNMFATFGPEFHKLLTPAYNVCPSFIRKRSLPFYGGEMLTLYQRST